MATANTLSYTHRASLRLERALLAAAVQPAGLTDNDRAIVQGLHARSLFARLLGQSYVAIWNAGPAR